MFSEKIGSWKQISAGFAIFGFILSFITGLFGRVSFGVIILRAFLFAVVFAGISLLIMKLIEAFIPELFSEAGDDFETENSDSSDIIEEGAVADEAGASGQNLDITIDDDENDDKEVQDLEELEGDDDTPSAGDEEPETLEELGSSDDDEATEDKAAEDKAADDDDEAAAAAKDDEKELPDIEVFSDSFEDADTAGSSEGYGSSEGLSSIDGTGSSGSAEILGGMHETQELVKAVKTVLKKDQEG